MRPTLRDVLVLVGWQLGLGALVSVIAALLPGGSNVGMIGVGVMSGALAFTQFKEKRDPGRFVGSFSHWLALWSAVAQLAIGLPFLVIVVVTSTNFAPFGVSAGAFVLIVTAIACPLAYGLTRLGIRMGVRLTARARLAKGTK